MSFSVIVVFASIFIPLYMKKQADAKYEYEVVFTAYLVSGNNKTKVSSDNFKFDNETVENSVSSSDVSVAINSTSYALLEYKIVNRSKSISLNASVSTEALEKTNCLLEYGIGDDYWNHDSDMFGLEVAPDSTATCSLKISIDKVSINSLCQGNVKMILSIM